MKFNTIFTLLFSIIYGGGVGGIVCFLIPMPSFPLLCNPANPFLLWVKRGSGREKDTLSSCFQCVILDLCGTQLAVAHSLRA